MANGTSVENPPLTPAPVWGVFWFGAFLGLLTAASTASGTTVALIGLLFTLAGGSFLVWYRPDTFKDDRQRAEIVRLVGAIGKGGLAGLLVGFAFQFARDYWVTPAIYAKYKTAGLSPPADSLKPPEPGGTFRTQSATDEAYSAVVGALRADAADPNTKLTAKDIEIVNLLAQDAGLFRDRFKLLKQQGALERLSPRARESLDAVIKASP